jgi:hypothetical protein
MVPKTYVGEKTVSLTNGVEKTGYLPVETTVRPLSLTLSKKIILKWINNQM